MYTTSTIIADLSDEPRLPFVNMTMTKQADHDDMVETMERWLFEDAGIRQPITSRTGRDMYQLMNGYNERPNRLSISLTRKTLEAR